MSTRLRVTYTDGKFIPVPDSLPLGLRENEEVEITIEQSSDLIPLTIADPKERARVQKEIAQEMMRNSFTGDPPRFTREELHERR